MITQAAMRGQCGWNVVWPPRLAMLPPAFVVLMQKWFVRAWMTPKIKKQASIQWHPFPSRNVKPLQAPVKAVPVLHGVSAEIAPI
jgi:hypothetical protein